MERERVVRKRVQRCVAGISGYLSGHLLEASGVLLVLFLQRALAGGTEVSAPVPPLPPGDVDVLEVLQVTDGVPVGKDAPAKLYQRLVVDREGRRLALQEFPQKWAGPVGQTHILRLDRTPPVIWTVRAEGKRYKESFGDLNDLQKDRLRQEHQERWFALQMREKERDEYFRENPHVRRDGKRIVTVKESPGDVVLGYPCRRLVVKENDLTVIDVQITQQVGGGRSFFHLYRRLGAFSEEVLERLAEVKGVPLRGRITVVTALPTYTLDIRVVRLAEAKTSASIFALPQGAVKEEPPDPTDRKCARCGKAVPNPPPAKGKYGARWVYFDSEECAEDYYARRVLEKKPERPAPPTPPKQGDG